MLPFHSDSNEAGLDEAGRGCLAGPVVAASVILTEGLLHPSTSKTPTENGKVVVHMTVDKNGKVTKATLTNSNITTDVPHNCGLAIEAARKCTFTSSNSSTPQTGTITLVLVVK